MSIQELVILLPCHSLDDFPVYHQGDDAQSLLASWSGLWHPGLLAATGKLPSWKRVDDPPANCDGLFMVVPTIGVNDLPTGFSRRAEDEGGCLVSQCLDRDEIAARGLEYLGSDQHTQIDRERILDFYALGYCYLQIQLLTRHMRYSSNLDLAFFEGQVIAGALAALENDAESCREKLQACFDVLAEERDHFYPVDAFLLDLTIVAGTTTGSSLVEEVQSATPSNLLMSGHVVEQLGANEPETIEELKSAIEKAKVEIVGGEIHEHRLSLLGSESIRAELVHGLDVYEQHLGTRPTIYGRRRFGLTTCLPTILVGLGFQGALHATLDDGRFPEGMQIKVDWEGALGQSISAFAKVPFDASLPETFLNLAIKLGEQMDMDHVATVCFAHWPGGHSPWYDDLRRAAGFSNAMGTFLRFTDFFDQAADPGFQDRFKADQYRSPYLQQAVSLEQPDPISRSIRYWQEQAALRAHQSIDFLASSISGKTPDNVLGDEQWREITERCEEPSALDNDPNDPDATPESFALVDRAALRKSVKELASLLPRDTNQSQGYLIFNPCNFVRRMGLNLPKLDALPDVERPIYAADQQGDDRHVVVDVPSMGFAWIASGNGRTSTAKKKSASLAEEYLLRNEYCEVVIDQNSGGLRSIHEYNARKNRLSQQLAYRIGGRSADEGTQYSRMLAEEVKVIRSSQACGQIASTGKLVDHNDEELAKFVQTVTIWRGCRVIDLEFEIELIKPLQPKGWDSYIASRFAWRDEAAEIWCGVNQHRQLISTMRFEAPEYVEIEFDEKLTTLLTGGLPFHRKSKMNMLDSLLIVHGERQRRFKMGIGLDVTHPAQAAESLLMPSTGVVEVGGTPTPAPSSWLFHLDAKNVAVTSWENLGSDSVENGQGCYRLRLIETMGRSATANLQSFRPFQSAEIVSLDGKHRTACEVNDGVVAIPLEAHQYIQVEVVY